MLTGIRYQAQPTREQAIALSQWMGCARVIWNAKCEEDRYLRLFARKHLPVGTYPPIDKTYGQYKTELTPWLTQCPSQILRNSATIHLGRHVPEVPQGRLRPPPVQAAGRHRVCLADPRTLSTGKA